MPRRVSGYNLDSLLPGHGFDVAGLLVGSESTLVTVLRAELKLVPVVRQRTLVVLGYPSVGEAGDAVSEILRYEPIALEGIDHRVIHDERLKREHMGALEQFPEGRGWLLVQFGGDTIEESDQRARQMVDDLRFGAERAAFLDDPEREDELWRVREGVLSATSHVPGERETSEGWDDSAVPPERLGDYLRDLEALYERHGYADEALPGLYGHFGQGCVHSRVPFDLSSKKGVADYRRFMEQAADLVAAYGGCLSGEHGDGQRAELLPRIFGPRITEAFGRLKAIFDPQNRMNHLCLACKGCKSDCPVNVDMATYKAEFLAHHWKAGSGRAATTRSAGCRFSPWPPPAHAWRRWSTRPPRGRGCGGL